MSQTARSSGDISIRDRLKAWWHGYEMQDGGDDVVLSGDRSQVPLVQEPPAPGDNLAWSRERIFAAQMIFGKGCESPGVGERTSTLIKPLALNEQMTILELGAGLGAGARIIAHDTGAWIDAIEPNKAMAEAARKIEPTGKSHHKITFSSDDLGDPAIQKRRRDAIVARESLHRFEDRGHVLEAMRQMMKPGGQVLITDFMLDPDQDQTDGRAWMATQSENLNLYSLQDLRKELQKLGFQIHVAADESREYCTAVLGALQGFALKLQDRPVPAHWREWVMTEIEHWARIVAILEGGGGLKLYRVYASVPAPEVD